MKMALILYLYMTALINATKNGFFESVKILCDVNGIDINVQDKEGIFK